MQCPEWLKTALSKSDDLSITRVIVAVFGVLLAMGTVKLLFFWWHGEQAVFIKDCLTIIMGGKAVQTIMRR